MSTFEQENYRTDFGPFNDLEEQQYKRLYKSFDVPLYNLEKAIYKKFLWGGSIFFSLLVFLGATIKIPNFLEVPFRMESQEKERIFHFTHDLNVLDIFVKEGDSIYHNIPLFKVTSPEIAQVIAEIHQTESELNIAQNIDIKTLKRKKLSLLNENKYIALEIDALKNKISASQTHHNQARNVLESDLLYLQTIYDRQLKLFQDSVISEAEFLKSQRDLKVKVEELNLLEKKYHETQFEMGQDWAVKMGHLSSNQHANSELQTAHEVHIKKMEEHLKQKYKKLEQFYGACSIEGDAIIIKSSISGLIKYLYPDYQILKKGEILCRIEVHNSPLFALGIVSPDKAGYLKKHQKAVLKIFTFPYYDWGVLDAEIVLMSTSPDEEGHYRCHMSISSDNPKITPFLQNGQSGKASIKIENKTIYEYLVRRTKKMVWGLMD